MDNGEVAHILNAMADMLEIKGDNPFRIRRAARANELRGLPGIKAKTEENILWGIEMLKRASGRMPLGLALPLAGEIIARLRQGKGGTRIGCAGRGPRMKDTVGDIDILAVSA